MRPRRPPATAAALAPLVVAIGLLSGCGGSSAGSAPANGGLLSKRQDAPTISGATLDGGALNLASLQGKVVVLNFYASWCGPCRAETPMLERTSRALAARGVEVVGVDTTDTATNARSFGATYRVTYPSLSDPDRTTLARFKHAGPAGLPKTFVLDRSGKVAARYVGPITDEAAFDRVLNTLAAEPA